jgi:hypothetical protein
MIANTKAISGSRIEHNIDALLERCVQRSNVVLCKGVVRGKQRLAELPPNCGALHGNAPDPSPSTPSEVAL